MNLSAALPDESYSNLGYSLLKNWLLGKSFGYNLFVSESEPLDIDLRASALL